MNYAVEFYGEGPNIQQMTATEERVGIWTGVYGLEIVEETPAKLKRAALEYARGERDAWNDTVVELREMSTNREDYPST